MGSTIIAVLLTGAAIALPGRAFADQATGDHATRGIVQAIDAKTIVIARSGQRGTMTFSLTPSTRCEGVIVAGATVSVRYREAGKDHVAMAIALQRPKEWN